MSDITPVMDFTTTLAWMQLIRTSAVDPRSGSNGPGKRGSKVSKKPSYD